MGLTRVDLLPQVRARLAANTNDALLTTESLYQSINNGLANFASERDWYWQEAVTDISTAVGTQAYPLPNNCTHIHTVSIDGTELDMVQYRELLRYAQMSTNKPQVYATIGNQIYLAPVPNDVYILELFYQQAETTLTTDADQILCPDFYADAVVTFACLDAAIRVRDQALIGLLLQLQRQQLDRIDQDVWRGDVGPRIVTRNDNRMGHSY